MNKSDLFVWLGLLAIYQFYATFRVAGAKVYDHDTKIRQIILIWALPFVGAIWARMNLNAAEEQALRNELAAAQQRRDAAEKDHSPP